MTPLPAAIWAGAVIVAGLAFAKDPAPVWKLASSGVPAVALVSAKESHEAITLTFRNTADKNIAAFALVSAGAAPPGEQPWVHGCFTERVSCLPAQGRTIAKIRPSPPRELSVAAVLFENGASLGDPQTVQYLKAMRAGSALEIEREKALLKMVGEIVGRMTAVQQRVEKTPPRSFSETEARLRGIEIAGLTASRFKHASDAEQDGFFHGVLDARSRFVREFEAAYTTMESRASTLNADGSTERVRLEGRPEAALNNGETRAAQRLLRDRVGGLSVGNHQYYENPANQRP